MLVVVPTLGQRDLQPLIRDLGHECGALVHEGHDVEGLVLHNGPSSPALADHSRLAGLAYDSHERKGFSSVRNEAIRRAIERGFDVVAMIDDDERPATGWLTALVAPFATGADVVVGPVLTTWPEGAPARFVRSSLPRPAVDLPSGWIDMDLRSGNCAIRVSRIGATRFDEQFNRRGGEDTAFFRRLRADGARCFWQASAVVRELVDTERVQLRYFARRALSQGRSFAMIQRAVPRSDDLRPFAVLRERGVRAARLAWWGMRDRNAGRLLESSCEAAFMLGYASGRGSGVRRG